MEKAKSIFAKAFLVLMFVFGAGFAEAQAQNAVSGTIKDATGAPLPGVAVMVDGSTTGTVSDFDGKYQLSSVPSMGSLVFSFIGFETQTIPVAGQSTIDVVLQEESIDLNEIVAIGYGVQRKSDLTGAVASVSADDLKAVSTTDAAAALQGKAPGVHIINSGAPGDGATIRVRGYSSNSSNIGPLLIVDGLQVSSIQYLDPSMIESMEVLKDAASAAIYGAEAGNGVVLITTKQGKKGHTSFNYSGKASLQNFTKRPMMNRAEFLEYQTLQLGKTNVDTKLKDLDYKHPYYSNGVIDTDWIDAYIEPTWNQQHSFSFSGGNDDGHFFAAINYVKNNGVVKGDKDVYTRLTSQVNADYQIFKWLQIGSNNSIEKWETKSVSQRGYGSSFESLLIMDPLTPVYWTSPDEMSLEVRSAYERVESGDETAPDWRFFKDEKGWYANTKYADTEGSALAKRDISDGYNNGFNINGTLYLNLSPIKGLTYTSRLGYRISQSSSHSYQAPYYIGARGSNDNYSISASANTGYYYQWENFINYSVDIEKHSIAAMVGMSYRENNSDNVNASSSGADILSSYEPNFRYINYVKSDSPKTIGNAPDKSASLAYFGRLIYSFDNRYSLQANFRADAFDSSKLSKENRWGKFPSVSAGWTVSNESFIKDNIGSNVLSFLKIRGSWGRNGNISVLSGYKYDTTISSGNNWYQYSVDKIGSTFSSSPSGIANPSLTWETSEQFDLGLDARFLESRLSLTLDYFNKKTKDLLFNISIPAELGYSTSTANGGKVLNSGLEVDLGWKDRIGDFSYSINANFSSLHNEVLEFVGSSDRETATDASSTNYQVETVFEPGHPIWYLRGYVYDGVKDGKIQYKNFDDDPEIGTNDMVELGHGTPSYTYGVNINLAWKGIDFTLNGAGVGGNSIMPVLYRTGFRNHMKVYLDKYKDGEYPHPELTNGDMKFWSSSANVFDGSFFRIKQLQLGYTLPQSISQKALIKNLRVYVSLDDFFTFTKYPGLDPETASTNSTTGSGLDWGSYPTMKKTILGVDITF